MARKSTPPLITDFDNIPDEVLVPVEQQSYPIPEHWKWVRLGAVARVIAGSGFPMQFQGKFGLQYPFFKVGSLKNSDKSFKLSNSENSISDETRKSLGAHVIPEGSLLFAKIGEAIKLGRTALAGVPCCIDNNMFALQPMEIINSQYLLWWSKTVDFYSLTAATTVPSIRKSTLEVIPFPLPPLREQERIVDVISKRLEYIDASIHGVEQFLAGFDNHKEAIIQAGVSGHLTVHWREKNGVMREDWTTRSLRELGKWGGGGTPRKSNPDFWENGTIPWVTPKDVKSWTLGDTQDHVTQEGINGSTANLCIGPAIAFVVRSGILRRILPTTLAEGSFAANQDMKVLHNISEDFEVRFIHHLVRSEEARIRSTCAKSGTTVESIDFQKLLDFKLRFPLNAEQKEIVRLVDSKLESLKQAEALAQESLRKLNALRDSIVSAALSGRLT